MEIKDHLEAIFAADRSARAAESELLDNESGALSDLLAAAVDEALGLADEADADLRLRRLADLCAQVPGPAMADALLKILDHPDPSIRNEAGEALRDVAFTRFKEVARAVERALDRGDDGVAMEELPFVLTEVHDPDPLPLVARFLAHPDPQIVAAAIDALAGYGDPEAGKHLEPLLEDEREAILEDLDDTPTTIGELAGAALEELGIGS